MNLANLNLADLGVVDFSYSEKALPETFKQFDEWVSKNLEGPLTYLSDHRKDLRSDLKKYFPEFKSALVFLFSYKEKKLQIENFLNTQKNYNGLKIASYTTSFEGHDYHYFLRDELVKIGEALKKKHLGLEYKLTLDIHPVLERDLAYRSGLGWFGKNSMLISTKHGSFCMIGSLLLNQSLDLETKKLDSNHCGTCTACIDYCPTDAILDGTYQIDAAKCISTFTIETFKDVAPEMDYSKVSAEVFGCDICQDVCPWNSKKIELGEFTPSNELQKILNFFLLRPKSEVIKNLESISNREFRRIFKGTSFERTGRVGMLKNYKALM